MLTQNRKRRIKEIVGKCEIPGCKCRDIHLLEIHHIDGNHDNDIESNILVICREHHTVGRGTQYGHITVAKQREIVKKRSLKKRKEIQGVIREGKKNSKKSSRKTAQGTRYNRGNKKRVDPINDPVRALEEGIRNKRWY